MKARERVYYLDWLRIFAVVMLVPFHTAMIFVTWPFHIKNSVLSQGLTDMNGFIHIWHMPLFFCCQAPGHGSRSVSAQAENTQRKGCCVCLCRWFSECWQSSRRRSISSGFSGISSSARTSNSGHRFSQPVRIRKAI